MSKAWISGKAQKEPTKSGGGRIETLAMLDGLVAETESQSVLKAALVDELHANPLRFFRTVIMPLLPRDAKLTVESDGIVEWRSLLGDDKGDEAQGGKQKGDAERV